jgi:hypothetical protein
LAHSGDRWRVERTNRPRTVAPPQFSLLASI